MSGGFLRRDDWLACCDGQPAHAYATSGPVNDSRCGTVAWHLQLVAVTDGPLCAICREIVAGAAFHSLEEIAALEHSPSPIRRVTA
jgi:hypothetical protein